MPGTTNHLRQYTSSYYTPFRLYASGADVTDITKVPTVDFSASESAERNEVIIIPFKTATELTEGEVYTPSTDTVNISVYALVGLEKEKNNPTKVWVNTATLKATDGVMTSISPLFAIPYRFVADSANWTINASNNAVNVDGSLSTNLKQTYPVVDWGDQLDKSMISSTINQSGFDAGNELSASSKVLSSKNSIFN